MNIYAREFRLELESQDFSRQTRQALWERGNNDPKRSTRTSSENAAPERDRAVTCRMSRRTRSCTHVPAMTGELEGLER